MLRLSAVVSVSRAKSRDRRSESDNRPSASTSATARAAFHSTRAELRAARRDTLRPARGNVPAFWSDVRSHLPHRVAVEDSIQRWESVRPSTACDTLPSRRAPATGPLPNAHLRTSIARGDSRDEWKEGRHSRRRWRTRRLGSGRALDGGRALKTCLFPLPLRRPSLVLHSPSSVGSLPRAESTGHPSPPQSFPAPSLPLTL